MLMFNRGILVHFIGEVELIKYAPGSFSWNYLILGRHEPDSARFIREDPRLNLILFLRKEVWNGPREKRQG